MTDIIKSLEHHSKLANKYIELYEKAINESVVLQVVIKQIILCLKGGYLSEELIEKFLDQPHITQEALNYIYDNRTTTKGNEERSEHQSEGTCS